MDNEINGKVGEMVSYEEFNFRHMVTILIQTAGVQLDILAIGELWKMKYPNSTVGSIFIQGNCMPNSIWLTLTASGGQVWWLV